MLHYMSIIDLTNLLCNSRQSYFDIGLYKREKMQKSNWSLHCFLVASVTVCVWCVCVCVYVCVCVWCVEGGKERERKKKEWWLSPYLWSTPMLKSKTLTWIHRLQEEKLNSCLALIWFGFGLVLDYFLIAYQLVMGLFNAEIWFSYKCLRTVIWYHIFLSNSNNSPRIVWFWVFLSNTNYLWKSFGLK